ncbi:MAG: hypothetical protein K5640_08745 [Treponema sp.]|nr:hypothetical protein [Treponema sp.]
MVEIRNVEVFNLERAQRAIENSFNVGEIDTSSGPVKEKLAKTLGNNMQPHQSHDAYLKGILVTYDIKGNGVFMPEFQRYHHHEIIMSQSTMHSMEKFMTSDYDPFTKYITKETKEQCKKNYEAWIEAKKTDDKQKIYEAFEVLVHNLPRGFELWATVNSNYLQLKTQVIQRFHHKNIEDWKSFVEFCYSLPKFRDLCGFTDSEWNIENW